MEANISIANQEADSRSIIKILESLEKLIIDSGKVKSQALTDFDKLNIAETMGADSLDMVRFVVFLEQQFSVQLDDEVVIHVETFGELANAIYDASK